MNRAQAIALVQYLSRGVGIVPTTGAEWELVKGALTAIEGVANGLVTLDVKPILPPQLSEVGKTEG